ncbi:MAG: hypothetical protein EA349_11895 [Halomonadaceae bacterium]|nr:MAG: hypothetical protein EA349_11895 [Halomonadaceae bacterium]
MQLLLLAATLGVTLLYVPPPGPGTHRLFQGVWDHGHVALFAVLTLLGLRWRLQPRRRLKPALAQVLLVLVSLALVTEGLQLLTPYRNASLADAGQNLLGLALGLAISPHLRQRLGRHWRPLPQLLAMPVLAWLMLPHWLVLADSLHGLQQFPQLFSLAQPTEMSRVRQGVLIHRRVAMPQEPGGHVLAVNLPAGGGGLALDHLVSDWHGCEALLFRLWAEQPVTLRLRIHDLDHDWRYKDRFNHSLSLVPGWQTLAIPLEQIAGAPAGRRLNLRQIQEVALFNRDAGHEFGFQLSEIRLSGGRCG